jgi:hypothetical protein
MFVRRRRPSSLLISESYPNAILYQEALRNAIAKYRLHDEGYALITAQNAAAAAERGKQRGRGQFV